jgi:predicted HicB family RNase H-like nuclease
MTAMRKKATRARRASTEESWVRMLVRVRREELERYRRAADRAGLSVSEWVRSVLERASRTRL